jgi:Protein of unknown function (DUF4199)
MEHSEVEQAHGSTPVNGLAASDYKEALRIGALAGLTYAVLHLGLYFSGTSNLLSNTLRIFPFLIVWGIIIYLLRKYIKAHFTALPYMSAFVLLLVSYGLTEVIWAVFNYVLYNIIDPGLANEAFEEGRKTMENMFERFDVPEEAQEKAFADFDAQKANFKYDIWNTLKTTLFFAAGFNLVLSAIAALFLRKKEPDFE